MKVEVKDGQIIITLPLQKPEPSSTGKSLIVATTGGFTQTEAKIDGRPVKLNVTAIIKP